MDVGKMREGMYGMWIGDELCTKNGTGRKSNHRLLLVERVGVRSVQLKIYQPQKSDANNPLFHYWVCKKHCLKRWPKAVSVP